VEIRRLRYFVAVAELGSLGRAADVLRVAQPALTRQVRLLEQELGVTLFTRSRRGMHLTEDGRELLGDVSDPLRQLDAALHNIRSNNTGLSGQIAMGMTPTVTYFLAQKMLERMAEIAPNVVLRIVEGSGTQLSDGLLSGELDLGLLYEPLIDQRLVNRELLIEEMVIVGAVGSGVVPEKALTIEELTKLPLILPNPKNGLRSITERYAAKFGVHFQIRFVIDSFPVLKEMIRNGHGYSIMPLSSVIKEIEEGTLSYAPVLNPSRRTLVLSKKTHCRKPRVMEKLESVMEDVLRELHDKGRIFGDLRIPGSRTRKCQT